MGDKSLKKKNYILDEAAKVFKEKGYKNVTMKDIVEACDISRGGLYLYFDSTETLFKAVIENESRKQNDTEIDDAMKNPEPSDLLTLYFVEQKKDILNKSDSLLKAIYEYSFSRQEYIDITGSKEKTFVEAQKENQEKFLESILKEGIKKGEFREMDTVKTAKHIVCTMEGLKILSRVSEIKEKDINDEMVILYSEILPKNTL